jgi:hypothetical protein
MFTTSWQSSSGLALFIFRRRGHGGHGHDFRKGVHSPVFFLPRKNTRRDGESARFSILRAWLSQLRDQLVDGLQVVGIHVPVDQKQVFRFRLFQQVGQFGTVL